MQHRKRLPARIIESFLTIQDSFGQQETIFVRNRIKMIVEVGVADSDSLLDVVLSVTNPMEAGLDEDW